MGDLIADFIVWGLTTWAGRAVLALLMLVVGGIGWHMEYGTEHSVTFTITGIEDQGGYNSHKYLIFTTHDGRTEVFENTDAFLHGKNDSSDVQARFVAAGKGSVWNCPVYGFRNFFSSSYRDILDGCKQVVKVSGPGSGANFYPTPNGKAPLTTQLTQTSP
jgi:hypothetical protein